MAACGPCRQTSPDSCSSFGIGAADRVAIVLPNGPEMATAFVTIAQAAVTAPLNPAYRTEGVSPSIWMTCRAKALVVAAGYDGPAVAAAEARGVTILRLAQEPDLPAGHFDLSGPAAKVAAVGKRLLAPATSR